MWRDWIKNGDNELKEPLYDIEPHKVGDIRTRQKYSFPCDNSVIRVDKNFIAGRRSGSNVVCKDNFSFGIRERDEVVNEKVAGDDTLKNMDSWKETDRRCEFWLEFENGSRMHCELLNEPDINEELIPVDNNDILIAEMKQKSLMVSAMDEGEFDEQQDLTMGSVVHP